MTGKVDMRLDDYFAGKENKLNPVDALTASGFQPSFIQMRSEDMRLGQNGLSFEATINVMSKSYMPAKK